MVPNFDIFKDYGGPWITILIALSAIAYVPLSKIKDHAQRAKEALSEKWLMMSAVGIALLSWVWSFRGMFQGDAYLRGADKVEELSTILVVLVLVLAGVAWKGISWQRFHPWITHGIVLALIGCSGALLAKVPNDPLFQEAESNDRDAVRFVQSRLASLNCFVKTPERHERRDGTFETLTADAIILFQTTNSLFESSWVDTGETIGAIRRDPEFSLLARPFPFLFGPKPCSRPVTDLRPASTRAR